MSIEITQQVDYNTNLELLLEQYKYSDNMVAMISAFNDQMTEVESALFEIRDEFYLDTAVGVQLDTIGTIFNELRKGRTDTEYRAEIRRKGATFLSGRPEDIITQLKVLYNATTADYYGPERTGEVASYIIVNDGTATQQDLEIMSPAGVRSQNGRYLLTNTGGYLKTNSDNRIIVKR